MELVTGRKGSPHVTSQQDRMKNQGIFGADSYILNTGKNLAPEVQSSNEIRIRDGAIMVQGALGAVKVNTYDSVTIQNGNQGMKRIDLICWQYTYEAERDIESADWIVIQGTSAEADPQQPEHISGSIQKGDAVVQVPVFAVHLDGINVTGVDVLIPVIMTNADLSNSVGQLSANAIVEEGKNSNGYYRKWNNGTMEMWGSQSITRATVNQSAGGVYHSDNYTFSLPYTSLTNVSGVSLNFRSNAGVWAAQSTGGDLKKTLGYWVFGGTNTTVSGSLNFRCTGTWK